MIKKILFTKFLIILLFSSSMFASQLEPSDLIGIELEEIQNKEIVTYNKEKNQLKKIYYFVKNSQLYKKEASIIYPTNTLNSQSYRILSYKKGLKDLGCKNYKAKECIHSFVPTSKYFDYDGERHYILEKKEAKIYNLIKYNYNKTLP